MPFKLKNPTSEAVRAMYAGSPYMIPALGSIEVHDRAVAEKLASDLAPHGVTLKESESKSNPEAKGKAKGKE